MRYQEFEPLPALRRWVASIWSFEVPSGIDDQPHAIPLTGAAILGMNLQGGVPVCFGPRLEPFRTVLHGGDRYAGVHLWPGVHRAWLGPQSPPLREAVLPLAELVDPRWVVQFGEALQDASRQAWTAESLEELGRTLLARTPPGALDEAVMAAMLRILKTDGRDPVGGLAAAVGLSPATLRRRFQADLELSPKELARIRRVRASATDAVAGHHWAGIAANRGFSDQAHLVREFQELLGRPPESFRAHGNQIHHQLLKP